MKRHMQKTIRNHSQALCNVQWKYSLYIQYDPSTITCKRCLSMMARPSN